MSYPVDYHQLSTTDMERLHAGAMAILADPGLKIMEPTLLKCLEKAGATVDHDTQVVKFPEELIMETLAGIKADKAGGLTMPVLNGVIASRTDGTLQAKFGGACCSYYDWDARATREPNNTDVITMLRLGEAIPDVAHVGNPVIYMKTDDGDRIPPHLKPIKTAQLVAKNTSRPYSCEVWSVEGLEFQIEIGCIVRGGWDNYLADPIFITAKETISPLQFPREDAEVLMALAKKGLPCTVVPMPISGASCPITPASNVAMAAAEILGVFAALRSYEPKARVAAGVITGVMDMSGGNALFTEPMSILQDRMVSQLFADFYDMDLGVGTGYIDSAIPGTQSVIEKTCKMLSSFQCGKTNYPVGIVEGGKTFCPEQAILDLEVARTIHKTFGPMPVNDDTLAIDVIRNAGIAGNVLADEHTVMNFRDVLHLTDLFDRSSTCTEDMLDRASRKWKDIVASATPFELDGNKADEIDKVVEKAEKYFETHQP